MTIVPDSGRISITPRYVIFRFDEVVSERPAGSATLDALFLISPRAGAARVDWSRKEIAVRPRRGWRPNTTYTVTLLPGLSDLRGNTRNTDAVTIFSTGSAIAASRVSGTLFNWIGGDIVSRGVVEALSRPDTITVYVATTDSIGNFLFPNLPPGRYTVRGFVDQDIDRALDSREPWDSVSVNLADSAAIELLAFVHDSIGTRIASVEIQDSVTLRLAFDGPLSVTQPLASANIRVRASDSTDVPVLSVAAPPRDTAAAAAAPRPSLAPVSAPTRTRLTGPTTPVRPPGAPTSVIPIAQAPARPAQPAAATVVVRRPSRPLPISSVIVKLGAKLRPGADYRVRVTDARNLIGVARSSERVIRVPTPQPPTVAPPPPPPRPTSLFSPQPASGSQSAVRSPQSVRSPQPAVGR